MLVSQIAKNQMDADTIRKVEESLNYFGDDFPESSTFITASCFPDDITTLGLSGFKVWHGVLTPYSVDNFLTDREIGCIETLVKDNNLHSAIGQGIKTLKNPKARNWEKSFMLRFLFHCVADIHQPLHCVQLYSQQFPHGDLAGHRFLISGMPYRNLHLLWDSIFGLGNQKMHRPLTLVDEQWICENAAAIENMFPINSIPECEKMDYLQWSEESYQIAIQVAYRGVEVGEKPSTQYLAAGQHVAMRQIALAGYRLARLFNELFND
ncbi:MAG: hypothetical protein KR126chlam2_00676 [Chlamydiae bacterium]|nr:hypothetical protein [Chlamydiota bacterium]